MADALTGLTEVSGTIETIVSAEIQEVLSASIVVFPTLKDISAMVGPGMNTVKIPRFSSFTVQTKSENTDTEAAINAFSTDDLALDQHKYVSFLVEDIADLQSRVNTVSEYVKQAGVDLAVQMDQALLDGLEAGVSTSAPDHKIAYAGSDLAKIDVLNARELLNVAKVPMAERCLIVSPGSEAALMNISEFTRVDEAGGSAALRNGQIGRLFGFDVLMSPLAEDLKTMAYHKSTMAVARQLAPRAQSFNDIKALGQRWVLDHIYGYKQLDGGKRSVLLGTA